MRPAHNEWTLLISLTGKGRDMKRAALSVPDAMKNRIGLSMEECIALRDLLNKPLATIAQKQAGRARHAQNLKRNQGLSHLLWRMRRIQVSFLLFFSPKRYDLDKQGTTRR